MEIVRKVLSGISRIFSLVPQLKKNHYRNCAIFFAGAFVIAVISLNTTGFAGLGKNNVHSSIEESTEDSEVPEEETTFLHEGIQAGFMGLINSVHCLEEYSEAAACIDVENIYENILVGTPKVRRNALDKVIIGKNMKLLSEVGYYAKQAVRNNQMPAEDYYALLQIVEAEATGGDIHSKILIANVVMNRVEDSHFPNKIYDVIWERKGGAPQFSPTADGRIHRVAITDDTYEAIERVLAGEDYSRGALFFVARADAEAHNVKWFDENLEYLFEYGGHEYYTFEIT